MRIFTPTYSQQDPQWKTIQLGTSSTATIGSDGCAIDAASNCLSYFGHLLDPGLLNQAAKDHGGYDSGDLFIWKFLNMLFPDVYFTGSFVWDNTVAENYLTDPKNYVIAQVGSEPIGGPRGGIHFIGLLGDGKILDSWDGQVKDATFYPNYVSMRVYVGTPKDQTMPTQPTPAPTALPANYADIIHNSTEYEKVVHEYIGADAVVASTPFEAIQKVVAGFKSQVTAVQNQLNTAQTDLASAQAEVANRDEQVGRLNTQLSDLDVSWQARYDALNKTVPDVTALNQQWESKYNAKQLEVDQAQKDKGAALVQVATLTAQLKQAQSTQLPTLSTFSVQQLLGALISKIVQR